MARRDWEIMLKIKLVKLSESAKVPSFADEGSNGCDLYANIDKDKRLRSQMRILVKTGISIEMPEGTMGLVVPRSGLALKHGVTVLNGPGLIDTSYSGEIGVVLYNTSPMVYTIKQHDRIAQLVFVQHERAEFEVVDSLSETERQDGGFGSSGK